MAKKKSLHAIDWLSADEKNPPRPVCVTFGDELFLKRNVLERLKERVLDSEGSEDAGFSLTSFEGQGITFSEMREELSTMAMFGGERLVVVEDADPFVKRFRTELEDYVVDPLGSGILVLQVKSFPSNTRLFKAVAAGGLTIDCNAPPMGKLTRWLTTWARQTHEVKLASAASEQLVERIGPELGLLDQELAKMAVTVGIGGEITVETVEQMVGTWRAKTTWDMLDMVLDGKTRDAIVQLDRLLFAGEHPIAILAQISATLRRMAAATRLILQSETTGRQISLRLALEQAGVKRFVLEKSDRQLRRLGRHRGDHLFRWLLEADLALKGGSALAPRLILERLIVRLAAP